MAEARKGEVGEKGVKEAGRGVERDVQGESGS